MTDPKEETLTELFARDPFSYSKQDIDRLITYYRDARRNFVLTGKGEDTLQELSDDEKKMYPSCPDLLSVAKQLP